MTTKKATGRRFCTFWDCKISLRPGRFLCNDHYRAYRAGEIDVCPGCKRYKLAKYPTCQDCRKDSKKARRETGSSGGSERRTSRYQREHSEAWAAGDAEASEFYVYVLKLDDGSFYAGQSREIRERLMEHRDGQTKSTAGRNPKLVWFTTVASREQAADFEVQVKRMCDRNPREIRRWIRRFQDLVEELDFD